MSVKFLRLFGSRSATATVARERLQILLAHERGLLGSSLTCCRGCARKSSLRYRAMLRSIPTRLLSGWTGEGASRLSKSISSSPTGSNRRSRPRADLTLPRREDVVPF